MKASATPNSIEVVHGEGSPVVDVLKTCARIAPSDVTVLITGETGTGKEVFARLLHNSSCRAGRPMVSVNCGAIPETLLESELFGYAKGAFTGAVSARRGRIAMAEGGTLFLDEVGELPPSLQVKLLRVLQERVYEPVGSTESVRADFRLITATNRDLEAEVAAGRFRRDLYYRLMVCPVELPALRDRRGDVGPLFQHFWSRRGETRPIEPQAMQAMARYEWPGNVRELENLVERLSVCCEGGSITAADLPEPLRSLGLHVEPATAVLAAPGAEAFGIAANDDRRPPLRLIEGESFDVRPRPGDGRRRQRHHPGPAHVAGRPRGAPAPDRRRADRRRARSHRWQPQGRRGSAGPAAHDPGGEAAPPPPRLAAFGSGDARARRSLTWRSWNQRVAEGGRRAPGARSPKPEARSPNMHHLLLLAALASTSGPEAAALPGGWAALASHHFRVALPAACGGSPTLTSSLFDGQIVVGCRAPAEPRPHAGEDPRRALSSGAHPPGGRGAAL
ncbi:MAG: sigma 54-interacting transcriptional regulator [Myxococcales bacterium]